MDTEVTPRKTEGRIAIARIAAGATRLQVSRLVPSPGAKSEASASVLTEAGPLTWEGSPTKIDYRKSW